MIRNLVPLLFLVLLVLSSSCGKSASNFSDKFMSSQIIVGELDWQEITVLASSSPIRLNGHAVASVDLPVMGSRCTGFMVSDDILMTNQHCIPSATYAKGVTARFKHEKDVTKLEQKVYDCSTFVGNDENLDYALLKCVGRPGLVHGKVRLATEEFSLSDGLYIVQQNCDYYTDRYCDPTKKYSRGIVKDIASEYTHNADTLGGSSGSPVFSEDDHMVYAIHHAGYGNDGRGRGHENYAVPMHKIVQNIEARFPDVELNIGGATDSPDTPEPPTEEEENTSSSQAKVLVSGVAVAQALLEAKEVRYYKLTVMQSKVVSVELNFTHRLGDLDLYVSDSFGRVIAKSLGVTNTEKITKYLTSGVYTISVVGYRDAHTSFSLKSSF